jgi:hypothetical protein
MTREQAKRRAELYSALAAGKIIQVQNPETGEWEYLDLNKFDGFIEEYNFRIKPEPKYRPFKNAEECWNEMMKHQPFGWIKNKATQAMSLVSGVSPLTDNIKLDLLDIAVYSMYSIVTFADGTPFGIKEE